MTRKKRVKSIWFTYEPEDFIAEYKKLLGYDIHDKATIDQIMKSTQNEHFWRAVMQTAIVNYLEPSILQWTSDIVYRIENRDLVVYTCSKPFFKEWLNFSSEVTKQLLRLSISVAKASKIISIDGKYDEFSLFWRTMSDLDIKTGSISLVRRLVIQELINH